MTAESDALSYWLVTIVPESKLSHMATAHYSFVPKLSRHGGKNPALCAEKPLRIADFVSTGIICFSSFDKSWCFGPCQYVKSLQGDKMRGGVFYL